MKDFYLRSIPRSRYKTLQQRIQSQQEDILKLESSRNQIELIL
jgi:hypothetical protein